jgi:hypothetical protein
VSDADERRVPRSNRRGWDGRDRTWDASGLAHSEMVSRGANIAIAGRNEGITAADLAFLGRLVGDPEVEAGREREVGCQEVISALGFLGGLQAIQRQQSARKGLQKAMSAFLFCGHCEDVSAIQVRLGLGHSPLTNPGCRE